MEEGPRGPRGFRGRDSSMSDFCTWLPGTVISNLQANDENGAFFIQNPETDLIRDDKKAITQWVSRSRSGGNLIASKPANKLETIHSTLDQKERYAMKFKNTQYKYHGSMFLARDYRNVWLYLHHFSYSEEEQVLASGYKSRSPPGSEIKISGATEIAF